MTEEGFSEARAELFEALGHPMRIRILEALEAKSMGFAELKKKVGIESSGHLQFHLKKLGGLVVGENSGTYALNDDGKEALRVFRTTANWAPRRDGQRFRLRSSKRAVVIAVLLVIIVIFAAFAATGGVLYTVGNQMSASPLTNFAPGTWYTIGFNGSSDKWVDFNILIGSLPAGNQSQQIIPIHIQLAHKQGIDLKSLKLEFAQSGIGSWAFDSVNYGGIEGYPPPEAVLNASPGYTGITLQNWGFVGTGSVNIFLNLVLDRSAEQFFPAQNGNSSIRFQVFMQLQDSNYVLVPTEYTGSASVFIVSQTNGLLVISRASQF